MLIQLAADGGIPVASGGVRTTTDPLRFEEAWQAWQRRVPIPKRQWLDLEDQARQRAFTAADVTSLDVLEQLWRAIDSAVANGDTFGDFQGRALDLLGTQWSDARPGRIDTIFRTNVQHAYAAGRYQQMSDPDVVEARPFWEFVAILDDRTTEICYPLEGVTKPANDAFWRTHNPPLHFNCRSTLMSVTEEQAAGRPRAVPTHDDPLPGFGAPPDLRDWQPDANDYPPELWTAFQHWHERR